MTDVGSPVYRAVFGDVGGAHKLIAASPDLPQGLLNDLAAHYTDRLLSTEHAWSTYRCGFPVKGYYVLTQTFPVKASRGGMVQTHAVMLPLDRVGGLRELEELAGLLPTEPAPAEAVEAAVAPTTLDTKFRNLPPSSAPGYLPIIRMLLQDRVPVWVGQPGFWEVVVQLWRNLWPAARERFHFRVASEPSDVDGSVTLLCTLKETRSNWDARTFVNQSAPMTDDLTRAEAFLAGAPEGEEVTKARARLGFSQPKISDINRLGDYVDQMREGSADSVRYATRLLGQLAPEAVQIPDEKARVLKRLATLTAQGSEADVLGLRNLNINAFSGAGEVLKDSICTWMRERVHLGAGGQEVAKEVFLNKREWDDFARPALVDAFSPWQPSHTAILWNWWVGEPTLIERTAFLLPAQADGLEQQVTSSTPECLPDAAQDSLLGLALARRWYLLHATVLGKAQEQPVLDRFRRQIQFDADQAYLEGLQSLAQSVEPMQLVQVAAEIGDARLVRLAADAVRCDPKLLLAVDPANANWREIWSQAVTQGLDLYLGLSNAQEAGYDLLLAAVDYNGCPGPLLDRVVTDTRTNLRDFPRRAEVWPLVESPAVRQRALRLVASQWLNTFISDELLCSTAIEPDLEVAVLNEWTWIRHTYPAASVLRMHGRFSALGEQDVVEWLNGSPYAQSTLDARALGKLILDNRWKRAAERLADVVLSSRGSLDAAIHGCIALLGRIRKIRIWTFVADVTITEDEWWDEFLDRSSALFPYGVSETNIWYDSGGDPSLIPHYTTGRDQWTYALNLLRNGGGGPYITIPGLLHQMRRRFLQNGELETLEQAFLRGIR
jgi:hypothetical protein